jgi:hypothetical protein
MVLKQLTIINKAGFDNCRLGCFATEHKISVELTQPHLDLKKWTLNHYKISYKLDLLYKNYFLNSN